MLDEKNMNINEIINYGYPYYKSINIYNVILNQLFGKKEVEELIRIKDCFYNKLKTNYSFPNTYINSFVENFDIFTVTYNERALRREITFNYKDFVYYIANSFSPYNAEEQMIQVTGTVKQIKNLAIKKLKNIRDRFAEPDILNALFRMEGEELSKDNNVIDDVINSINRLYRDIYINNMYNVDSLFEKCDKERLLFHIMVSGINICSGVGTDEGLIYTIFKYYQEKDESTGVSLTYKGYLEDSSKGKLINYSYPNFMQTLQKYVVAHPEYEFSRLDFENTDMTICEFKSLLREFDEKVKEKYRRVDDITFLPSKLTGNNHSDSNNPKLVRANLIALKKKKLYSLYENQIYEKLQGKEKLKGYTAMVFKNGYVILEINDIKNDKIVTKSGAAYIMPLPLFNKLYDYSRTELRQYKANNPNSKLEYIEHRENNNWEERIQKIITMNTGITIGEANRVLVKNN